MTEFSDGNVCHETKSKNVFLSRQVTWLVLLIGDESFWSDCASICNTRFLGLKIRASIRWFVTGRDVLVFENLWLWNCVDTI